MLSKLKARLKGRKDRVGELASGFFDAIENTSFDRIDIYVICSLFTLMYTYYWLDIRDMMYNDIDVAYNSFRSKHSDDDTALITTPPYDAKSMSGPILAVAFKSLVMSFTMFLILSFIVVTSTVTSITHHEHYLKEDIKKTIQGEIVDPSKPDDLTTEQRDKLNRLLQEEQEYLSQLPEGVEDPDNESDMPSKNKADLKDLRDLEAEVKRNAKDYRFYKDLKHIYAPISKEDKAEALAHEEIVIKATTYWLFFFVNFWLVLIAIFLCFIANIIFNHAVIPYVTNIDTDPDQMKMQVLVVLCINYAIFIGFLWYGAFKLLGFFT